MLMGLEDSGKPGELSSLHCLQVPKPDAVTDLTAIPWNESRGRSSELFSVGMKATLLLPLPSPFHYMAKGGGNSQQHLAQALQQCGGPSEELPEYFLWAESLNVTTHGVEPVECGFDVQAPKEVSRVLLVHVKGDAGDVLAVLGLLPAEAI